MTVEERLRTAFRDIRKLGECDSQEVGGQSQRLSVKIAGGVRLALQIVRGRFVEK